MPLSLRIPPDKENLLNEYAKRRGTTKTAVILEAVDEKLGLKKSRYDRIKEFAGWLSPEEASDLKKNIECFEEIIPGDWQ